MSNTGETIGGRKRVGPEDEAREDQMDGDETAIQPLPMPVGNDGIVIDEDDDGSTSGDFTGQGENAPSERD